MNSLASFQPFSWLHAIVILAFIAITLLLVAVGRRQRRRDRPSLFEQSLGWLNLLLWAAGSAWALSPARFDPAHSLPLHLCDVTSLSVSLMLIWRWLPARAILYFLGLGLSTQGLLTPDLSEGPGTVTFWLFWGNHISVPALAVYDLAVNGFRPTWREYAIALGAGLGYLVLVLPINLLFDLNYGYVGRSTPAQPTVIDLLGPWPQRIGVMVALIWLGMTLMLLPWLWVQRRRSS